MKPVLNEVTAPIREHSALLRQACMARVAARASQPRGGDRTGCVNVAHGFGPELFGGVRKTVSSAGQGARTRL
jgi:hypothetical protein